MWRLRTDVAIGTPHPVAHGTAFVPTGRGVTAVDVCTGATRWSVGVGVAVTSPLVTSGSLLLVVTDDGVLHAVDLRTHAVVWRHPGTAQGAQVTPYGSVALVGERSGALAAIDLATGRTSFDLARSSEPVPNLGSPHLRAPLLSTVPAAGWVAGAPGIHVGGQGPEDAG